MLFAYDMQHWITFFIAATLLNMTPGPDMAFILAHTARGGRAAGFAAMFGVWTGALGHVILAAAGLSALVVASATAYAAVRYIGAAYLIWIGVQALIAKAVPEEKKAEARREPVGKVFRQGVLIDLLNPKVAIFFLAFLPQFTVPEAGPMPLQLVLHGLLIIAVGALIEPPMVILGERISQAVRGNRHFGRWMDRSLGAFFLFLGLRLAVSDK